MAKIPLMKKIFIALAFILTALGAQAQNDTIWRKGGLTVLNFNQVAFSNWAAGGDNSVGGNAILSLFANKKINKWVWDNNLDLAFGASKIGTDEWKKNDDKIELNTKVGYEIAKNFYLSYLFNFKTQFTEGFNYPNDSTKVRTSNFMTPGYFLNSLGIDWKPNNDLSCFLSPITVKTTVVTDQTLIDRAEAANISLFGVDIGENVRNEVGAYFAGRYTRKLMENIQFNTRLELFSNYLNNPQNIDVNWEVVIAMKVNKYISAMLSTQLLYDNDVFIPKNDGTLNGGAGTQFKESFGIGFSYKFQGYGVR